MKKAEELNGLDDLKAEMKRVLQRYVHSRTRFISGGLFRSNGINEQKAEFVNNLIKEIDDFDGTKTQFVATLKEKVTQHALLSRQLGKNHYNLDDQGAARWINVFGREFVQIPQKSIEPGQLRNSSDLAGLLHGFVQLAQGCRESWFKHDDYQPIVRFLV